MLIFRAWATCEKTGEKDFWRRITRVEIITDYNTKAVNVYAYQKRDNNSDTARKGYKRNPTTDEQFIIISKPGEGTWVFFGWVCAARDSKLAPRSKKKFP